MIRHPKDHSKQAAKDVKTSKSFVRKWVKRYQDLKIVGDKL